MALHQTLLDLVFPPRCAGCGRRGAWLCAGCLAAVRYLSPPWCERCGEPLASGARCSACLLGETRALDWARAACAFGGPLRQAIHRFKYEGERARAGQLADLLTGWTDLPPLPAGVWLVPVPLDPGRRRERGYNQAEELARVLAGRWHRPLARELYRVRATRPQVGLGREERQRNVAGAFAWRGAALSGQPLVLIDDVMTTGATAEACAVALKEAGAGEVALLTLARPIGMVE